MRKDWIKIGALLILAAGLAATYMHLITQETPSRIQKVFSIKEEMEITAIQVHNQYGDFSFGKEGEEWRILSQENQRADQKRLQMMASILRDLQVTRVLTEDLPEYGLHSPSMEISFNTGNGKAYHLAVGNETVSRAQVYASAGEDWIYLLDLGYLSPFDVSEIAYRDKEIFTIDRDHIQDIAYQREGDPLLELKKIEGQWQMIAPYQAGAREIEIQEFLVQLRELKAVDQIDESVSLKELGMLPPEETLTLTDASGKKQILEFGANTGPYRTMRRSLEGDLYTIYEMDLDLSKMTPDQLLFESPFKTSIDLVEKMEISFEDQSYRFSVNTDSDEYIENGELISRGDMVSIFMKYITILADGYEPFVPKGEPVGRLATTYTDGHVVEVLLYPREAGGYGMSIEGDTRFYLEAERVEKLLLWAKKPLD